MKRIVLIVVALAVSACTQPDKARVLLTKSGYTGIEITGYRWLGCSKDDTYHTGFKARTATGQPIEGTVCAGMFFKGATIRFE